MVRFLPPDPSIDHVKKQAKSLYKAHGRHDAEACAVLRNLHRFRGANDDDILSSKVPLTEVQFALALEYGFSSWPELRSAVVSFKPADDYISDAKQGALILPNPITGVERPDRFAAAFSMALSYLEAPVDYETVSGDMGLAFIFQADSLHRPYGADVKNLDIGWWPLDEWGALLRLDFLGRVAGVPVRQLSSVSKEYKADPAEHYRKRHEAEVTASLRAGRPAVMSISMDISVAFGLDSGSPPLLVQPSCTPEPNLARATHYPWLTFVIGEPGACIDRRQADIAALDYAVRLGRDEVDLSHLPGKSSGRRSWELWASQLSAPELCGPNYYHANVVHVLSLHRKTAASYLRTMSERHPGRIAEPLQRAAESYDSVVDLLGQMDTGKNTLSEDKGREQLISQIREAIPLETQAQEQMSKAISAMRH